jgi:hypothetical protein
MASKDVVPRHIAGTSDLPVQLTRRVVRQLVEISGQSIVREAAVRAEAVITAAKLHEVDYVTYEAMNGQAFLRSWAAQLASEDILLADELRGLGNVARLGKGQILADLVDKYRRMLGNDSERTNRLNHFVNHLRLPSRLSGWQPSLA